MLVYTNTDEADVGRIRVGAPATFRVDTFPREIFNGRVDQQRMNATTIQNVVTYNTTIAFDNPDLRLFPGMTAYASIPVATATNVVKIPNGALRFKPDLTDSQRQALYTKYNIMMPGAPRRRRASWRLPAAAATGGATDGRWPARREKAPEQVAEDSGQGGPGGGGKPPGAGRRRSSCQPTRGQRHRLEGAPGQDSRAGAGAAGRD